MNNIDKLYSAQALLGKPKQKLEFSASVAASTSFRLTVINEHGVHIEISPHHGQRMIMINYSFHGQGHHSFVTDYDELKSMFPNSNLEEFKKIIIKWEMKCVTTEV